MSKKKEQKNENLDNNDLLKRIDELDDLEESAKDDINQNSQNNDSLEERKLEEDFSEESENIEIGKEDIEEAQLEEKTQSEGNSEETTENVEEEESEVQKAIIKVKQPVAPTLLDKEQQRKKKNLVLTIMLTILIVLVLIFSVIFAFMNVTKTVIINGVLINNIDVSNLSIAEAKDKITEAYDIELNTPIELKSDSYELTLNTNQIEFNYNISKAVEDAYSVGRNGNIFQNNYAILMSAIFGKEVEVEYSYNEEALEYIVNDVESKMPGLVAEASYYIEDNELIITSGKDGIIVDKEKLKEEIINTILTADAFDILQNNTKLEIEIPIEDAKAKDIDIDYIYSQIYTEPKDAYYEAEPFKIYTEVNGVDFAISKDEAKEIVKEKQDEYKIPLKITPASKTIKDIGLEAFPYLISEFSTKYDASNKNRSENLAIAAGKIDGTVLMPGEEFSFNQVVGKRTIQEGYKDAKIYQDGQVVDGLAGGICQISSTLYNAVVKANLEVTERRNHSFTTSYIRAGQDATVVYGVIDFKFKNTRTYPIKISASVNSGIAEFKINGIKEEVEYEVLLSPVTTGTIPYTTQYIPDATLAPGQQVVVQKGGNGLKVTTYKDTKLDGKLVSREVISTDTYRPMQAIVRVGP